MLCVADTNTNIIKVNNIFEKVMGYTVDEVEGKSFLFFIHEEDKEATIKATNELSDQKPVMGFTNRFRCKDG
jgi:PAS domain S-box-containing protein